jgi:hypothetical protein
MWMSAWTAELLVREIVLPYLGVFVSSFLSFFISFQEIQKLDGPKNEKLEAHFHELLSFSLLELFSFLIS